MTLTSASAFGRNNRSFIDTQLNTIAKLLTAREDGHPLIPLSNRQLFEQFYYYTEDHHDRVAHYAHVFTVDQEDILDALETTWSLLHRHGVDPACGHEWLMNVINDRRQYNVAIPMPDPFRLTWGSTPRDQAVITVFKIIDLVNRSEFTKDEKEIFRLTLGLGSDPHSCRQLATQYGLTLGEVKGVMRRFWIYLRANGVPHTWDSFTTRITIGHPTSRESNDDFRTHAALSA